MRTTAIMYVSAMGIIIYNVVCTIREIYNICQQKLHYVLDPAKNLVAWFLYISSMIMISPVGIGYFYDIQVGTY